MDLKTYIQLIFLCVVNVFFTFCGIFLNALVILSFIKSSQLRKKASYFMIMILSCVDLLAVATNHPLGALSCIVWLNEQYDVLPTLLEYMKLSSIFFAFSFLTLFVMSIDRYLAIAYPLFHRVSVTKRRLLTLLASCFLIETTLAALAFDDWIITFFVKVIVVLGVMSPPFLFINIKLLMIVRRERKKKTQPRKASTIVKLKNISTCLLAILCLVLLSIPTSICTAFSIVENLVGPSAATSCLWGTTICSMNSTLNCLIFYWKNKALRQEGMKIVKSIKSSQIFPHP